MAKLERIVTRRGGHPWDGMKRPGFDLLEFDTDDKEICDKFVNEAMQNFWQPWLVGVSEDGKHFGGLLFKPSGITKPWEDSPQNPHPGGLNDATGNNP